MAIRDFFKAKLEPELELLDDTVEKSLAEADATAEEFADSVNGEMSAFPNNR